VEPVPDTLLDRKCDFFCNPILIAICTSTIKMDLLETGLNVVDWIGLAQDRYRWRALVNSVMKLRVP
jgi:hypothetical protein